MMSSKDVLAKLKADGWRLVRSEGDHFHFAHPEKSGLVTVKHPPKDLGIQRLKWMENRLA